MQKKASGRNKIFKSCFLTATTFFICLMLLLRRGIQDYTIANSLWTEDGPIFANQAFNIGYQTLFTSYQGYLHTFQRIWLLASINVPLGMLPYALFLGWCFALFALVMVITNKFTNANEGYWKTFIVICAVSFQPHGGEVFFSITNTQWILGLALAIHISISKPDASSNPYHYVFLLVTSLTGPFSILLLPVMALQLAIKKDWIARWRTYTIVSAGAATQALFLITSTRFGADNPHPNEFSSWINAAWTFFTFGGSNIYVIIGSFFFWLTLSIKLFWKKNAIRDNGDVWYLLIASAVIFSASAYSVSKWSDVGSINPVTNSGRYYYVPFGLIFIAALIYDKFSKNIIIYLSVFTICICSVTRVYREDLQWKAFANFSTVHPGIVIPINPRWNFLPTWNVAPPESLVKDKSLRFEIRVASTAAGPANGLYDAANEGIANLSKVDESVKVEFLMPSQCRSSDFVGIEFPLVLSKPGYITLSWSSPETSSLARFYSAGHSSAQFAFEPTMTTGQLTVNFGMTEPAQLEKIDIYCR